VRIRRAMPSQHQRQRQRNEYGNKQQDADHGERQANVILPIEQDPGRQREPDHKGDRAGIDPRMELVEDRFVMGSKFPGHRVDLPYSFGIRPIGSCGSARIGKTSGKDLRFH
jgi:hypothetical protein